MEKKIKNLLLGAGLATAGVAAAGTALRATTQYLVRVALDREIPKRMGKAQLRGYREPEGFMEELTAAAERLERQKSQRVELESYDGARLVGHWFLCGQPRRILIAMHGWRSGWARDFGTIAEFWHRNGCSVLYPEQRAQGNSGGDYMGFGLTERYDCRAWAQWVSEEISGTLPLYLAGVSMGATTVLMASALELPGNVRGILADCGFTSPHAIWKHVAEHNLHLTYGLHRRTADSLCKKRLCMGAGDYSTVEAMRSNRIPVLFVHGTDDHFVPVEMTYENYQACAAPKRLLVVPGADHGMSYFTERERYRQATLDFWKEFDYPFEPQRAKKGL